MDKKGKEEKERTKGKEKKSKKVAMVVGVWSFVAPLL